MHPYLWVWALRRGCTVIAILIIIAVVIIVFLNVQIAWRDKHQIK